MDEDTAFRIFRQVHPFDNVPPAFTLFRIIQVGDAAYAGIFIGILPGNDFKETESGFEATHAGVVGIPVIVYVVFVFIGSGNSQNDVFLLRLRERHPLAPEAADGYHYFQSVMGDVVQRTRKRGMLQNGIDNHIVPVNLFKSNLPFAVALFSVAGDLREEGGSMVESQLTGILNGFGQLLIAVYQQVSAIFFGVESRKKGTQHNSVFQ